MNERDQKYNSSVTGNFLLEHAFKQLHAPLYFYALKFVENHEEAKDLVQDAFFSIIKTNGSAEIENLKAYLYSSVRNNCLNFLKRNDINNKYIQKEQERAKREIEFYDIHQTLVEKELHEKLIQVIEELPEQYKIPFKLSRLEELKNKEIAEKLELPVRTVETKIYRALKILRKKLKNQAITLFCIFYQKQF
jgi:RNA polymerase sigma-70 factor, ECF subfamily